MKQFRKVQLLVLAVFASCLQLYAQSSKKIILNDEISVEFPDLPIRREMNNKEVYLYKTDECAFMVGIARKAFPEYQFGLKLTEMQQSKKADSFLNQIIAVKLKDKDQKIISTKSIKDKRYYGKELDYLVNTIRGTSERFSLILLLGDTLYTFECWYLRKPATFIKKDLFFKSILVKD